MSNNIRAFDNRLLNRYFDRGGMKEQEIGGKMRNDLHNLYLSPHIDSSSQEE
jgi:hypothetical protein